MRFGAMLNEFQTIGISPTSVAGGFRKDGRLFASAGFCGPGAVRLWGSVALIAPCGGKSGLPNDSAPLAVAARATTPPAAPEASRLRLESLRMYLHPLSITAAFVGTH